MSAAIAGLNDAFRATLCGGKVVITRGVADRGALFTEAAMAAVQRFTVFTADNDPRGEHDFGAFKIDGLNLFWKIDTYADEALRWGASDLTDPNAVRVLTIMLALEY